MYFEKAALMNVNVEDGHDWVAELLPWYSNGTLGPVEQAFVDKHLAICPECCLKLEEYQQLSAAIAASPAAMDWQPSPGHFAQVLSAIDAEEKAIAAKTAPLPKQPTFAGQCLDWLKIQSKPLVWALALETLMLATLALFAVMPGVGRQAPEGAVYQTLSNARPVAVNGQPRVRIVFAEEATEHDIRMLLTSVQGHLVDGPSTLGVYTLELALPGKGNTLDLAVAQLRKHPKVRLAEPVAVTSQP